MSVDSANQANDAERLRGNIAKLLDVIGRRGVCRACGRPLWFVRSPHGKFMPITGDALNHFIDCKHAEQFRTTARKDRDGSEQSTER